MMLQSTFDSDKYRLVLTPFERDILWLLIRRHNGKNNGDISLGAREAAEWYGYRKTAANDAYGTSKRSDLSPPSTRDTSSLSPAARISLRRGVRIS